MNNMPARRTPALALLGLVAAVSVAGATYRPIRTLPWSDPPQQFISGLTRSGHLAVIRTTDGELWRTDGTKRGTYFLKGHTAFFGNEHLAVFEGSRTYLSRGDLDSLFLARDDLSFLYTAPHTALGTILFRAEGFVGTPRLWCADETTRASAPCAIDGVLRPNRHTPLAVVETPTSVVLTDGSVKGTTTAYQGSRPTVALMQPYAVGGFDGSAGRLWVFQIDGSVLATVATGSGVGNGASNNAVYAHAYGSPSTFYRLNAVTGEVTTLDDVPHTFLAGYGLPFGARLSDGRFLPEDRDEPISIPFRRAACRGGIQSDSSLQQLYVGEEQDGTCRTWSLTSQGYEQFDPEVLAGAHDEEIFVGFALTEPGQIYIDDLDTRQRVDLELAGYEQVEVASLLPNYILLAALDERGPVLLSVRRSDLNTSEILRPFSTSSARLVGQVSGLGLFSFGQDRSSDRLLYALDPLGSAPEPLAGPSSAFRALRNSRPGQGSRTELSGEGFPIWSTDGSAEATKHYFLGSEYGALVAGDKIFSGPGLSFADGVSTEPVEMRAGFFEGIAPTSDGRGGWALVGRELVHFDIDTLRVEPIAPLDASSRSFHDGALILPERRAVIYDGSYWRIEPEGPAVRSFDFSATSHRSLDNGDILIDFELPVSATDGTRAWTIEVPGLSWPVGTVGNRFAFRTSTPTSGFELALTTGEEGAETDVVVLNPGSSSYPDFAFQGRDGMLYFTAVHAERGRELWSTDGTPKGTRLVADFAPGPRSSSPRNWVRVGDDRFWFLADVAGETRWMELSVVDLEEISSRSREAAIDFEKTGRITEAGLVEFEILVRNTGRLAIPDQPGHELTDEIDTNLIVIHADATTGELDWTDRDLTWNGALHPDEILRIEILAQPTGPPPYSNQAVFHLDRDGDRIADEPVLSSDPHSPHGQGPTVLNPHAIPISSAGLVAFAALIGLLTVYRLQQRF